MGYSPRGLTELGPPEHTHTPHARTVEKKAPRSRGQHCHDGIVESALDSQALDFFSMGGKATSNL